MTRRTVSDVKLSNARVLGVVIAMTLALAGCGNDADTDPPPESAGAAIPSRWVAAITSEPASLDPMQDFSTGAQYLQAHVFDPLVDFEGPELEPTPRLATEWSQVDPTVWEFKLREGVTFHDGSEFDAEDVVYSVEQALQPDSRVAQFVSEVSDVEVIDPFTIRLHTKSEFAPLLASLTNLLIIPDGAYDSTTKDQFGRAPIGTGLYKVEAWTQGSSIDLTAFEDRWREWDIPNELVVRTIPETATRMAELQTGAVDLVEKVPLEQVTTLEGNSDVEVTQNEGVRQVYYWLNSLTDPLKDPRVRQAMHYAIDAEAIVNDVLGGRGQTRGSVFAPGMAGYLDDVVAYPRDVEKARSLLAEAGYPNGIEITINAPTGQTPKDDVILQLIANQLNEAGIKATLEPMDFATNVEKRFVEPVGDFDVAISTYGRVCDSDILVWGLALHDGNYYKNPRLDELMELERTQFDETERTATFEEIDRLLHEDPAHLYLYAYDEIYASSVKADWKVYPFRCNAGYTYLMPFEE